MNNDDHVHNESWEEEDVIVRVINEQIQILIDSGERDQKAIVRLQESLQAYRDYQSREVIKNVQDRLNGKVF